MRKKVDIGIIGDFEARRPSHVATVDAIQHAAGKLGVEASSGWINTPSLLSLEGELKLKQFDGFWAAPGSPKNWAGAVRGIKIVRKSGRPFVGT